MKAKFPSRAVAAPCLELFRYPVSGLTRDQTCCSNGSWVLKVHGKEANSMQFPNMVQIKKIFISFIHHENDLMKITRMHSSRMRTACSSAKKGRECLRNRDPSGQRPPWTETPSGQRSLLDRDPFWTEILLDRTPPPAWTDKRLWKYYVFERWQLNSFYVLIHSIHKINSCYGEATNTCTVNEKKTCSLKLKLVPWNYRFTHDKFQNKSIRCVSAIRKLCTSCLFRWTVRSLSSTYLSNASSVALFSITPNEISVNANTASFTTWKLFV